MTDEAECPICGTVVDAFDPSGTRGSRPDAKCPTCGSLERHRAFWLFFRDRTNLFTDPLRMLHVAPEESLSPRFAALPNIDYLSADLEPARAMVCMDLTSIDLPDDSFDVIYASHVLEHIPDDLAAMRELRRVLKPSGWAALVVPMRGEVTREDPSVTDPAERERRFGQHDHVRMYGHDGLFEERLRAAGFDVTVDRLAAEMDPDLRRRYRMRARDQVHLCTKAAG